MFRVRAEHLGIARGFVICGACDAQFNALLRIADEPPEPVAASTAPDTFDTGISYTEAALELPSPLNDSARVDLTLNPDSTSHAAMHAAIAEATTGISLPATEHAILFTDPAGADEAARRNPGSAPFDLDEVPAILRDDMARLTQQGRSSLGWVWGLASVLLLMMLAVQIAWPSRERIFAGYPVLKPYALSACAKLGCEVEPPMTVAGVELLARDVRDHPQYQDTLLVNATLANHAARAAAYPVIQLSIYDHTGSVLGVRRFQPHEYLDESIDVKAGMPPGRSVYIFFEIASAAAKADSFEFIFL